jgi:hypothetical protein
VNRPALVQLFEDVTARDPQPASTARDDAVELVRAWERAMARRIEAWDPGPDGHAETAEARRGQLRAAVLAVLPPLRVTLNAGAILGAAAAHSGVEKDLVDSRKVFGVIPKPGKRRAEPRPRTGGQSSQTGARAEIVVSVSSLIEAATAAFHHQDAVLEGAEPPAPVEVLRPWTDHAELTEFLQDLFSARLTGNTALLWERVGWFQDNIASNDRIQVLAYREEDDRHFRHVSPYVPSTRPTTSRLALVRDGVTVLKGEVSWPPAVEATSGEDSAPSAAHPAEASAPTGIELSDSRPEDGA